MTHQPPDPISDPIQEPAAPGQPPPPNAGAPWTLRLYVIGQLPRSVLAFANLKAICDEHLSGRYRIELIDLLEQPDLARRDQVLATPTLVRLAPEPVRKIIGDLSETERVLRALDLLPHTRLPGTG